MQRSYRSLTAVGPKCCSVGNAPDDRRASYSGACGALPTRSDLSLLPGGQKSPAKQVLVVQPCRRFCKGLPHAQPGDRGLVDLDADTGFAGQCDEPVVDRQWRPHQVFREIEAIWTFFMPSCAGLALDWHQEATRRFAKNNGELIFPPRRSDRSPSVCKRNRSPPNCMRVG